MMNDIQFIEKWLEDTDYIGYEMTKMRRTDHHITLIFRGTKHPECTAFVQQGFAPFTGIGALKITEYVNGEPEGFRFH